MDAARKTHKAVSIACVLSHAPQLWGFLVSKFRKSSDKHCLFKRGPWYKSFEKNVALMQKLYSRGRKEVHKF